MPNLYLMLFLIVLILCTGNTVRAQQTDRLIFDADNIGLNGSGQFTYSNQNSSVFGRLQDGNFGPGNCICNGGTTLSLRSLFGGTLSIQGGYPGLVDGNLFNQVFFSGSLVLDGGNYVLPIRYSRARLNLTFPARLTGSLSGYTTNPFTNPTPPIFTSQFDLQGTVKISLQVTRLTETPSGVVPHYTIYKVRYDFLPASPAVPAGNRETDSSK